MKGKILAIDFGAKHVGLAISDEAREFTFSRGVIKDFGSLDKLFVKIATICAEEKVTDIVFGLPLAEGGQDTPQSEKIRRIAQKLLDFLAKEQLASSSQDVRVALLSPQLHFVDESFSSNRAGLILDEIGVKRSRQKQSEDTLAAVFILRKYMV